LARVIQGVGAALIVPQVLSGIQLSFSDAERGRALGFFVMVLSGSAVLGQVLGGVLISADLPGSGWRPVFLINVPIGAVLIAAAVRYLPAERTR
jgi:MFS family permease